MSGRFLIVFCLGLLSSTGVRAEKPNVLLILVDDMGYGDPGCYNAESRCETPAIDSLAAAGVKFTDAHAAGALCVPARYGLLTGRYPCRASMNPQQGPVIDEGRLTLPQMLRSAGYRTAMIGKWHLGFEGGARFPDPDDLQGGPLDRGFDAFFGMHASLDIPPYFYIENRRRTAAFRGEISASSTPGWSPIQGAFWRSGRIARDFEHEQVLDRFAEASTKGIHEICQQPGPWFLYIALPAPHTPWLPAPEFRGRGRCGLYGEFMAHVDDVVHRLLQSLDAEGRAQDTLVLFASDNGPTWYPADVERFGHASAGPWRGMKADAWEGGHRIPFIIRWPGHAPAGTESSQLIGFVDVLPTLAELVGASLAPNQAEDGVSFLSALLDPSLVRDRPGLIVHHEGVAYRRGDWKLITQLGSAGFSTPKHITPGPDAPPGQLYHLGEDPGEQRNLWTSRPELADELRRELERVRGGEQ